MENIRTRNAETTIENVKDAHTMAVQSLEGVENMLNSDDRDELVKRAWGAMVEAQNLYHLTVRLQEGI